MGIEKGAGVGEGADVGGTVGAVGAGVGGVVGTGKAANHVGEVVALMPPRGTCLALETKRPGKRGSGWQRPSTYVAVVEVKLRVYGRKEERDKRGQR